MSKVESGQNEVEIQSDEYRNSICEANELSIENVELTNVEKFLDGSRFIYIRTPSEFGKYTESTESEDRRLKLQRESIAGKAVAEMGIPSVQITHDYLEIGEKGASIFFEKLSSEEGIIFASPEEIAGVEPELVPACSQASAEAIISLSEQPIPSNIPSEALMRSEPLAVYNTPDRMKEHFERVNSYINQEHFKQLYDEIIGSVSLDSGKQQIEASGSEYFSELLTEYRQNLGRIINQWPTFDEEFIVHGDAEPKNFYLKTDSDGMIGIPIDFEYAGATHHPVLGALHDLSNFQGRLWPNVDYQNDFGGAIFESISRRSDKEAARLIARSVVILAASKISSYPLRTVTEPNQITSLDFEKIPHSQAVFSILSNLPNVLAEIDERYLASGEASLSTPELLPDEQPHR